MKTVAVVTTTRAEYGLLSPLIAKISSCQRLKLELIVSGTHLSRRYGYTIQEIVDDGFEIAHRIPIQEDGNNPFTSSIIVANAIKGFAACFRDDRPDLVFISGDRTEMLGVAIAGMNERIPMAHYSGGEVTVGAVDDAIRHSLTKLSYLHFTSTEEYRNRVIRMGENPERVYNVGALGAENILHREALSEKTTREKVGIPPKCKYVILTFHPVTLDEGGVVAQMRELQDAMEERNDFFYVLTKANSDVGGEQVNRMWEKYASNRTNVKLVDSLGRDRYLSAIKYASFVMGNSSSGMTEAPILGVPSINIGDRQSGRIRTETVIDCLPEKKAIMNAMCRAEHLPRVATNIFGDGNTSERIMHIIIKTLEDGMINLKKGFYEEK